MGALSDEELQGRCLYAGRAHQRRHVPVGWCSSPSWIGARRGRPGVSTPVPTGCRGDVVSGWERPTTTFRVARRLVDLPLTTARFCVRRAVVRQGTGPGARGDAPRRRAGLVDLARHATCRSIGADRRGVPLERARRPGRRGDTPRPPLPCRHRWDADWVDDHHRPPFPRRKGQCCSTCSRPSPRAARSKDNPEHCGCGRDSRDGRPGRHGRHGRPGGIGVCSFRGKAQPPPQPPTNVTSNMSSGRNWRPSASEQALADALVAMAYAAADAEQVSRRRRRGAGAPAGAPRPRRHLRGGAGAATSKTVRTSPMPPPAAWDVRESVAVIVDGDDGNPLHLGRTTNVGQPGPAGARCGHGTAAAGSPAAAGGAMSMPHHLIHWIPRWADVHHQTCWRCAAGTIIWSTRADTPSPTRTVR